jgi:hypothetical protein
MPLALVETGHCSVTLKSSPIEPSGRKAPALIPALLLDDVNLAALDIS